MKLLRGSHWPSVADAECFWMGGLNFIEYMCRHTHAHLHKYICMYREVTRKGWIENPSWLLICKIFFFFNFYMFFINAYYLHESNWVGLNTRPRHLLVSTVTLITAITLATFIKHTVTVARNRIIMALMGRCNMHIVKRSLLRWNLIMGIIDEASFIFLHFVTLDVAARQCATVWLSYLLISANYRSPTGMFHSEKLGGGRWRQLVSRCWYINSSPLCVFTKH